MFLADHLPEPVSRHLWISLQGLKINIHYAESRCEPQSPFKIVKQRPRKVPLHISPITNSLLQLLDILSVVFDPSEVQQPLMECYISRIIHPCTHKTNG